MSNDKEIEAKIVAKGLTAPRITPTDIDNLIVSKAFHVFPDSCMTVCCLTLQNGFNTTGFSACASPENFNKEIGEEIAFGNAKREIWALAGYLLKQNLFESKDVGSVGNMTTNGLDNPEIVVESPQEIETDSGLPFPGPV